MKAKDFTINSEAFDIVKKLKEDGYNNIEHFRCSDIIDDDKHQYVDLVQEGGGVLGVALVGYTYVMEQMGIRFFSLGGASAGAINTLLMAALGKINEEKSIKVIEIISNKNFDEFIDGPWFCKMIINGFLKKNYFKIPISLVSTILHFFKHLGLNPGNSFYYWISQILKDKGVDTTEKFLENFLSTPNLYFLNGNNREEKKDLKPKIVIIATDITTETRVKFPEMRQLYWKDVNAVNPAEYVRASMSIPGFFLPYKVKRKGEVSSKLKTDWNDIASYTGSIPNEFVFVDGGIVSNFPIDVFHVNDIPKMPTFGVKLGDDRNTVNDCSKPGKFAGAIFNSARHVLDYQFILTNPDYKKLIEKIDTGTHNWLNFSMSDEDKIDLFVRGAKAADRFLRKFNWDDYKNIRTKLKDVTNYKN